jgi:hypothetical protein
VVLRGDGRGERERVMEKQGVTACAGESVRARVRRAGVTRRGRAWDTRALMWR